MGSLDWEPVDETKDMIEREGDDKRKQYLNMSKRSEKRDDWWWKKYIPAGEREVWLQKMKVVIGQLVQAKWAVMITIIRKRVALSRQRSWKFAWNQRKVTSPETSIIEQLGWWQWKKETKLKLLNHESYRSRRMPRTKYYTIETWKKFTGLLIQEGYRYIKELGLQKH